MKKTLIVIIGLIVIILAIVLINGTSSSDPTDTNSKANESKLDQAPSFSLQDFEDNTVSLSDFEGKAVVVNAWASWCPFCVDELPDFVELQEEFDEEIVVVAINRRESLATAKGYTDSNDITDGLVYLLDPRDSFYQSVGGFSMPETLFINALGEIVVHKRGPMDLNEMRRHVNEILE